MKDLSPYWKIDRAALYCAHVLTGLKNLPEESVHCVVSSPPYFGLRDYGLPPLVWGGKPGCGHQWEMIFKANPHGGGGRTPLQETNAGSYLPDGSLSGISGAGIAPGQRTAVAARLHRSRTPSERDRAMSAIPASPIPTPGGPASASCPCGAWKGSLGLESLHDCLAWARGEPPCSRCYVCHIRTIFLEMRRVLRKDGTVWWNIADSYNGSGGAGGDYARGGRREGQPPYPGRNLPGLAPKNLVGIPWRTALALQADGWTLRAEIVASKANPMPESVRDRPTRSHEYVLLLTKSRKYFYDALAAAEPAVSDHSSGNGYRRRESLSRLDGSGPRGSDTPWQPRPTRNRRSVWSITVRGFRGAHFATMSPDLVEPCVRMGTSAGGCCPKCLAPYERVTRKTTRFEGGSGKAGRTAEEVNGSGKWQGQPHGRDVKRGPVVSIETLGWRASCRCDSKAPVPCVVLDPFSGSGTTGAVALSLGRSYVGLELNPSYCEISVARMRQAVETAGREKEGTGEGRTEKGRRP